VKPTELDRYYEKFMDEFWPRFASSPMNSREPFKEAFEAGARALFGYTFAPSEERTVEFATALMFFYNKEGA